MKRRRRRSQFGSGQIAELGPALWIILVMVFFPMLDLMYMGMAFGSGWFLNHMVTRAVVVTDPTNASAVSSAINGATTAWQSSVLAQFIGVVGTPTSTPAWFPDPINAADTNGICQITTQVTCKPFMDMRGVPIINAFNIPGCTANVTFLYRDRRPQEEKGIN